MSKINRAPEVSVIICALNAALTLPRQLKALENQETKLPYEVILVDNGSEDDTRAVMEAWAQEPREDKFTVKVVDASATPGIPAARNAGARAASVESWHSAMLMMKYLLSGFRHFQRCRIRN